MATPQEALAVALPVVAGLALIGLATLVLRRGGKHWHSRLFGALFLLSGVKSLGDGFTSRLGDGIVADWMRASSPLFPDADAWNHVTATCALIMLPLLFLFCASFPHPARWMQGPFRRRVLVLTVVFLPSILTGVLVFTSNDDLSLAPGWLAGFDLIDILVAFNVLATGLTATALALLFRTRMRSPDHIERQQAGFVAAGFLPSFVATWVVAGMLILFSLDRSPATFERFDATSYAVLHYLSPLLEFLAAGLVAFAILKYNILGVDPRFRVGVKSAVVGFVFVLVFLVTQAFENIVLQGQLFAFAGEYGSFLLSGTTSIVLFKPIEKISGKVSDRLLPRPASGDAALSRAAEVYHAQCSYVLRDAQVSEREMAFLKNLRAQLGLSDAQARAIEEEVERLLKVDAPQTGATAGTAVQHVAAAHHGVAGSTPEVRGASPLPSERHPTAPDPGPGAAQPADQPPT